MKTLMRSQWSIPIKVAALGLVLSVCATAQTTTILYTFSGFSDGGNPTDGLVLSGNTLYGTAQSGGPFGFSFGNVPYGGTLFAVQTDGTGFVTLHDFHGTLPSSDGSLPNAELVLLGNTLYGTAQSGGSSSSGTVFSVNTDGSSFTTLHSFLGGDDGDLPHAGLTLSGNTLYGTTQYGGNSGCGTIFAIQIDGTGYGILYNFNCHNGGPSGPVGALILSGDTLYGTSEGGGGSSGMVFAFNVNGAGMTILHGFSGGDGIRPQARLVLSGNTLYGTTFEGGSLNGGTAFAVKTDGTGFTVLHNFSTVEGYPTAGLILSGNTLYGTGSGDGVGGYGSVFAFNTDGTGYTNLSYNTGVPGNPDGGLVLSGNTLYGTTYDGGSNNVGTVFSISTGALSTQNSEAAEGEPLFPSWGTAALLAGVTALGVAFLPRQRTPAGKG
jgi:uncharacterized repeat protein (TIGR03803 family)